MKSIIACILIFTTFSAFAQQRVSQGIGLRIGDPVGITYKKYLPQSQAFELIIGGTSHSWHSAYYQNSFDRYSKYDNYTYQSHTVQSAIYFQGRYLFQYNIPVEGMFGRLDWYWGVGGLLKIAQVKYRYLNHDIAPSSQTDVTTDVDLGPEGILGMEYRFEDVRISVFGEASFAIELLNRPGAFQGFGAVGVRYNFR